MILIFKTNFEEEIILGDNNGAFFKGTFVSSHVKFPASLPKNT